jgi:hypothetical protein
VTDWRTPEDVLEIGFSRSRVVMCNELHDGMRRSRRAREVGRRLLPVAYAAGCRHLALEALGGPYVEQLDLKALVDDALELGFELIPYETGDPRSPWLEGGGVDWEIVNAREQGQAANLAAALPGTPLLVWCGNSHHAKTATDSFTPMGVYFRELTGIDYFAIEQLLRPAEPGRAVAILSEEWPDPVGWGADGVVFLDDALA